MHGVRRKQLENQKVKWNKGQQEEKGEGEEVNKLRRMKEQEEKRLENEAEEREGAANYVGV